MSIAGLKDVQNRNIWSNVSPLRSVTQIECLSLLCSTVYINKNEKTSLSPLWIKYLIKNTVLIVDGRDLLLKGSSFGLVIKDKDIRGIFKPWPN